MFCAWQRLATEGSPGPRHFPGRPISPGFLCSPGSERAGKRAASIQTLLGTAKLNGLDPAAWLKDTLEKLPTWPTSRIDELLPLRREEQEAQD